MYLEQFKKDQPSILKYIPFIVGFIGFMALNIIVSSMMNLDASTMIQDSINRLGKNFTFFTFLIPFAFFLVLLFGWWLVIHKYSIKQLTTSRAQIDYKRFFFSFGVWGGINILVLLISYLLQPESFQLQFNAQSFIPLFIIALIFIPIQTSFEEYFFRGYFMQFSAFVTKNRIAALIITSVVFGLMHLSNPEVSSMGLTVMIFYIGCGFVLGIMTLMDEGLELALGFHAANNLLGALLVTSNDAVFQTDALFIFNGSSNIYEMLIQVFIIFPILLLIFSKKYNWANWKQKLFKPI
ncbi:CPBP family intramembrane glutamic endopeptidase [Paenimyroides aestuarii]|uniref:CPBP family intramembrane metalloprotease n=1 Tax=Paenimyroides aestuarii TaxID=2968490 RepID=A0ABY5NQ42_9FLAO|nr:CPBP family intramembrane glutamic endopeptidase [Paenimyroides aestuarii]UUV20680.1 CPBP family intramembrane metalloprotease [Paenimyroides aestuarii]